MTPEQQSIFISSLSTGWLCGLKHILECYAASHRALEQHAAPANFTGLALALDDAYLAFFNDARAPGEPVWTIDRLNAFVAAHYEKK